MKTEALQKALHTAQFLLDELVEANRGSSALISCLILPEIAKAAQLRDRLEMILSAIKGD